jgi:carbon monoxide dehydrogenase subunit G
MILDNTVDVPADPDAVFALVNDVERVARCLPGATLEGQDGDDTYRGSVKVKVGPISAAYAGTVRFLEVRPDERRLRLTARGADAHGSGDAEAEVDLSVVPSSAGSTLRVHSDLVVRGKIAQFGKGAITTVSSRLLDQFARNLRAQLEAPAPPAGAAGAPAGPASGAAVAGAGPAAQGTPTAQDAQRSSPAASAGDDALGLGVLLPPGTGRIAAFAATAVLAFAQGWLVARLRGKDELIEELRRGRR